MADRDQTARARERSTAGAADSAGLGRRDLAALVERIQAAANAPDSVLEGLREALLQGVIAWDDLREVEGLLQAASPGPTLAVERARRSPGQPLPGGLRRRFEASTGADLGDVRVHSGEASAVASDALGAKAWVLGRDIHFGQGAYAPSTDAGARVLAHEVAHTVQQGPRLVAPGADLDVSHPLDLDERVAVSSVPSLLAGAPVALAPTGTDGVARIQRELLALESPAALRSAQVDTREQTGICEDQYFRGPAPVFPASITFRLDGAAFLGPGASDTRLQDGFRALAASVLGLDATTGRTVPPEADPAAPATQLQPTGNRIVHFTVDLDHTTLQTGGRHEFRFSLVSTTSVLIEDLGPETAAGTPLTADRAAQLGFVRDPLLGDALWTSVLAALGRVPETVLTRVQDISFQPGLQARGPSGELAEYHHTYTARTHTWTRRITIYTDGERAPVPLLTETLVHELGHAVSERPSETPSPGHADLSAQRAFRTAVRLDGGRPITPYGGTSDEENFAECFSFFITRPTLLQTLRPHVYDYFVAYQREAAAHPTAAAHPGARAPRRAEGDDGLGADILGD